MKQIKDFVAYKLEEIDDNELITDEFTWVPVLFPYHPKRNLFFITLRVNGDDGSFSLKERRTLMDKSRSAGFVINSIYDACGNNPLFVVVEAKNLNDIEPLTKNLNPKHISFTAPVNIIKRFGIIKKEFPNINKKSLNFLEKLEENIGKIIKKCSLNKQDVQNEFYDIENWEKFIRFVPMNMNKIITIIFIQPPDDKIDEIIKEIEGDERIIDAYQVVGGSSLLIKIVTEDIYEVTVLIESLIRRKTYTITKIVLRTAMENGFSFYDFKMPKLTRLSNLKRDILRFLWDEPNRLISDRSIQSFRSDYDHNDILIEDMKKEFESVENQFVYKYSVKLNNEGWFKTLLFIKSSLEDRDIVWHCIRDRLLKVDSNFFSRKFYVVTGDFDFIVPVDFSNLHVLKKQIQNFLNSKIDTDSNELVEKSVRDIRIYFEEGSIDLNEIEGYQLACIKAMMPNSRLSESKNTPRNEYHKYYINELPNKDKSGLKSNEILKLANAMRTIELHSEKLVHAFVRFKIKDKQFDEELMKLKKDSEFLFLWREYTPVHNPGNKMFILTTENFDGLLKFVSSLDKYSRNTAISLIFMQEFFRPSIPDRLRCKPCRLPLDEKCDACPQYVKPKEKTSIRDVDLKITNIGPCKIAVVQLKIENMNPLIPLYEGDDKDDTIKKLQKKVYKNIEKAIRDEANIVVFPEMSIPESIIPGIKNKIKGHKIIVVAGTHLHNYDGDANLKGGDKKIRFYNTCPILISGYVSDSDEVKQYDVHKNDKSIPGEFKIEQTYKNIKIETGQGMLRFINTGYGNFSVIICLDFIDDEMINALFKKETDFIIVPSWNPDSGIKTFESYADSWAAKRMICIIANNGKFGRSGIYSPCISCKDLQIKLEKNEERTQVYNFNVCDLDRSRDKSIWERNTTGTDDLTDKEEEIKNNYLTMRPHDNIKRFHEKLCEK
ncbi:MAG: hypothetical protein O8C62_09275 [Candidatus Methanoperedens sp.]|nr:hypothetical protein [Candidatus Methanoperedens sp.]